MTQANFDQRIAHVRSASWREDFERLLHALYLDCSPEQAASLRQAVRDGTLKCDAPWKNPTDYDREDLALKEKVWHRLVSMSLRDVGPDYRDDLCGIAFSYHSAKVVALDPDTVLKAVARVSSPAMRTLLDDFLSNPARNSLSAWSLEVVRTLKGPWIAVAQAKR